MLAAKKIVSGFLLLTMLTALSSCNRDISSETDTDNKTDTESYAAEEPIDPIDARKLIDDELPKMNFDGADFTVLTDPGTSTHFMVEENTGDVLNDAIYNRAVGIEERFGIKFAEIYCLHITQPATC